MVFTYPLGKAVGGVLAFLALLIPALLFINYWPWVLGGGVLFFGIAALYAWADPGPRPGTDEHRVEQARSAAHARELAVQKNLGVRRNTAITLAHHAGRDAADTEKQTIAAEKTQAALQARADVEDRIDGIGRHRTT